MDRVTYLDGLRGIAAFAVLLGHMVLDFFPIKQAFLISQTPLLLFFSGSLAIAVFFCLSGFVLSIGFIRKQTVSPLIPLVMKRYVRLAIPVVLSTIFACFLVTSSLCFNQSVGSLIQNTGWTATIYQFQASWSDSIINGLVFAFLPEGTIYNVVLWTMAYEFTGSCIIYALLAVFSKFQWKYRGYFYLTLGVVFMNSYFLCFIIGMICAEIYVFHLITLSRSECFALVLGAWYLGVYPAGLPSSLYLPVEAMLGNIPGLVFPRNTVCCIVSATLLLVAALSSSDLQKLLSSRPCRFLGRISFSLYLIHIPLLCSFSSYLFLVLVNQYGLEFGSASLVTCLLSIPVILAVSALFTYTDEWAVRVSHRVQNLAERVFTSREPGSVA